MSHFLSPSRPLRGEVRRTALLAGPLVLGHLSSGLIGFVDAVLAGRHGTTTLASVTIGTAMWWLPMALPIGALLALPAMVSQLDGAGRRGQVAPLFRQALWLALALGLLLFALHSALPAAMAPLGIAPEIIPGARDFLLAIRWGIPALTLYYCMRYLSDGLHWTMPSMVFGFGALVVLVPLGYALTFGAWGFPALAARGLGIASAVVLWLQAIGMGLYLWRAPRFAALGLFAHFEWPRWPVIRGLLAVGLPIGVTWMMEGSLFIVTALLIGRLGEVPAAAHQIAINVATLAFMVPLGVAEATTVRVGHALGRGTGSAGVRTAAFAGLVLVLATQAVSVTVLLAAHDGVVALYTRDAAVAVLASSLLLYAAAFQVPDGIQVLSMGALRGLKDTRVPMLLAAMAYWGIGMPLGAILGLGVGGLVPAMGPRGMWIGLIAGLSVAAVLLGRRFLRSSRDALILRAAHGHPAPSGGVTDGA